MKKWNANFSMCIFVLSFLTVSGAIENQARADTWTYSFSQGFENPFDRSDTVFVDLSFSIRNKNLIADITQLPTFRLNIDGSEIADLEIFCIECFIDPSLSIDRQPLKLSSSCCADWPTNDLSVKISGIQFKPSISPKIPPYIFLHVIADPGLLGSAFKADYWTERHSLEEGTAPIPEPSTLWLMGIGIVGFAGWRWMRGKQTVS